VLLHVQPIAAIELQKLPVKSGKIVTGIDQFIDSAEQLFCSLSGLKNRAKLRMCDTDLFHAGGIMLLLKATTNTIESDLFQADSF
jgi:hypothetical protein